MVFDLTHAQIILRYKENGGRIEPYFLFFLFSKASSLATFEYNVLHSSGIKKTFIDIHQ
jgi:hypothetical protein